MKKRKNLLLATGLGALLAMGTAGCGEEAADIETPMKIQDTASEDQEDGESPAEKEDGQDTGTGAGKENEQETGTGTGKENEQETGTGEENAQEPEEEAAVQPEKEPLSGKIMELDEDGMTVAQTTILDRDTSMVTLVDEEEAEKISVRFAEDVKVEYWRIEGGGADIDMQDRTLSDLSVGVTVEMEGYYEGDVYVATRILMEEYAAESGQPEAGTEELTGSVRSVGADSFVVSKSTTEHYDGYDIEVAAAPGSGLEELVTVYVNESAAYEFKTVKNAGIHPEDTTGREGSYDDLREGLSVTLKGHWEEGAFYAEQLVMMEFI